MQALPSIPPLPVVTGEIGDTWIYGVQSDADKIAFFRELSRARIRFKDTLPEAKLGNFSRLISKVTTLSFLQVSAGLSSFLQVSLFKNNADTCRNSVLLAVLSLCLVASGSQAGFKGTNMVAGIWIAHHCQMFYRTI